MSGLFLRVRQFFLFYHLNLSTPKELLRKNVSITSSDVNKVWSQCCKKSERKIVSVGILLPVFVLVPVMLLAKESLSDTDTEQLNS